MSDVLNKITDLLFRYFNFLFAILIAAMYANALIFPNMGADASFYLRVTECIADGAIPEYDLRILYPPLVFYMLLPIKLMVGDVIAYEIYLGYMFLFQVLNAYFIFKISEHYTSNQFIRVFSALMYLFLSFKLEGEYLILEPFVNFWGLLAVLLYIKLAKNKQANLFLVGILAFLAFLVKQYGLAYAGILYLFILSDCIKQPRKMIIRVFIFTSGLLAGLALFILVFGIIYGVNYDFFARGRLSHYGEKDARSMLMGFAMYLNIAPFLLLLLVPRIFISLVRDSFHLILYLILTLFFSVQLYFNQYDHYFILALPALMLIGTIMFSRYIRRNRLLAICCILICFFISEIRIGYPSHKLILSKETSLKSDIDLAENINNTIPDGAKVFLFSNVKLYYLAGLDPIMPEKIGFAYSNSLKYLDFIELIEKSEYLIIDKDIINEEILLIDRSVYIKEYIDSQSFKIFKVIGQILVYAK